MTITKRTKRLQIATLLSSNFRNIVFYFKKETKTKTKLFVGMLTRAVDQRGWRTALKHLAASGGAESASCLTELQCGCRLVFQSNPSPERRSSVSLHRVGQTRDTTQYTQETKHLSADNPIFPIDRVTLGIEPPSFSWFQGLPFPHMWHFASFHITVSSVSTTECDRIQMSALMRWECCSWQPPDDLK